MSDMGNDINEKKRYFENLKEDMTALVEETQRIKNENEELE